jgi:hypothetical protein
LLLENFEESRNILKDEQVGALESLELRLLKKRRRWIMMLIAGLRYKAKGNMGFIW